MKVRIIQKKKSENIEDSNCSFGQLTAVVSFRGMPSNLISTHKYSCGHSSRGVTSASYAAICNLCPCEPNFECIY